MAYIPLNKIITNLSTNGEKYQTPDGVIYVGPYWKKYTGEIFSGKNPNDTPSLQLSPINPNQPQNSQSQPLTTNTSYNLLNVDDLGEAGDLYEKELVEEYLSIRGVDYTTLTFKIPTQYFPQPTEDDYKLGVFTRYFCVKINEKAYLELNKDTYTNLIKQNSEWNWQYYLPFTLSWTLTGEESVVKQTNFNMVILQEQKNRRVGLKEFLKFNYLKFYK